MSHKIYRITVRGMLRNVFEVRDGDKHVYTIESIDFFGKNSEMRDASGNLIYSIVRPFSFWKMHFHILKGNNLITHVEGGYGWKPKLEFTGQLADHRVEGKISGREFKIYNASGEEVGIISKKLFSVKDQYGIGVQEDENLELYILIPILLDKYLTKRGS